MSGHSGIEPPDASETVFVADVDPDFGKLDVPLEITESFRVVTAYLKTTRYVGAVDSLGFLTYGDLDVSQQRLAKQMQLTIHYQIKPQEGVILGPGGVQLYVYLHKGMPGRERAFGPAEGLVPSTWNDIVADVNTVDVRFPDDPCPDQRSYEWCGWAPTARFNEVSFAFTGTGRLTMEIDWMTLAPAKGDLQGLACRPVLLLHGWGRDATQMARIWTPGLTSLDIPSYALNMEPQGSIQTNAAQIGRAVNDLKGRFGVEKVNVVGFSKGGIDAREYVRNNDDVETLVMLASPNGGSFAADMDWKVLANATQMKTEWMNYYNSEYPMNAKMNYQTVAAAYDSWQASAFALEYGPNDEVVSQASVETNIPDPPSDQPANKALIPTSTTDSESQGICAQQKLANHCCLPYNEIIFTGVAQLVLSIVRPPSTQPLWRGLRSQPGHQESHRVREAGVNALQGVSSETATVPPDGVTQSHSLPIDAVDKATFFAFADGDLLSLELVSPSGTRIDATTPSTDPAVGHAPLMDAELFWYTSYQIENPETGPWTVEVTGTGAPSPDSMYSVAAFAQVSADLGVSMTVKTDRDGYVVGDDVLITATLTSSGTAVTDATVSAEIGQPDGTGGGTIILPPDGTGTDGGYSGTFAGTAVPGPYLIVVSAEDSVTAFSRRQSLLVNVAPSAAAFSGVFSDHGVDTDGDGRYDQLVIDVGVEIDVAGEYRVSGALLDGSGVTIEQVRVVQQLDAGSRTVSLLFDGAPLFDLALDGPYVLDDLVLEDLATLTGLARGSAYTTAAYSHDEFKRPVCLLTGNTSDRGLNADPGDQRPYEELVIEVEVDTLVAAGVRAVATLSAEDGTFVTTAQTFVSLTEGPNTLAFYFQAPSIYSAGKAGPYNLGLLNVWEPSADVPSVSLRAPDVVAVTQPYALEDFAPSPVYSVGGTVSGLEGEGLQLVEAVSNASVEPGNGPFTFSRPISIGSAYDVHVRAQPTNPMQVCSVVNGTGTVGPADVTDIAVECVTTVVEAGLDTRFGGEGKVTAAQAGATAIAAQSDRKIVVVGGLTLARFNEDGTPDASLGGGAVSVPFGAGYYAAAQTVAVQPDGKIVVAGYAPLDSPPVKSGFALARYTAQGGLDPDFAGGLVVTTDFGGGYGRAYSVLIQGDESKIVAAGIALSAPQGEGGFAVARYNADGSLDTAFGTGGMVTTPIADGHVTGAAAVLQSDGKVVMAGPVFASDGGYHAFYLVRYTVDGAPDPDFGDDGSGLVVADFGLGPDLYPTGLGVQSDGSIVVAGWHGAVPSTFVVARLDATGHPDPGFGSAGVVTTQFGSGNATAQAMVVDGDDRIVVAGYAGDGSSDDFASEDFALARYTVDGQPDDSFGDHGRLTVDFFADSDRAGCITIQPDGKVVVGGTASRGSLLGLIRLLP